VLSHTQKHTHAVFSLQHWSLDNGSYANTLKTQNVKNKNKTKTSTLSS